MSIIHDALKRKQSPAPNLQAVAEAKPAPAAAPTAGPSADDAAWMPVILGAGGVILAGAITWGLTRSPDVTIVQIPATGTSPAPMAQSLTLAPELPAARDDLSFARPDAAFGYYPGSPYGFDPYAAARDPYGNVYAPPGTETYDPTKAYGLSNDAPILDGLPPANQPAYGEVPVSYAQPSATSAAPPAAAPSNQAPVIIPLTKVTSVPANAVPANSMPPNPAMIDDRLPDGAITIEMASAQLGSVVGNVQVNGKMAGPGTKLGVGSELVLGDNAHATITCADGVLELTPNSRAKLTRLERRAGDGGVSRENVTIHLSKGTLHAVARTTQGTFLVSTDEVTAHAVNGAFSVKTMEGGHVKASCRAGSIKLVPTKAQDDVYVLGSQQEVTWNGKDWTADAESSAAPAAESATDPTKRPSITFR